VWGMEKGGKTSTVHLGQFVKHDMKRGGARRADKKKERREKFAQMGNVCEQRSRRAQQRKKSPSGFRQGLLSKKKTEQRRGQGNA